MPFFWFPFTINAWLRRSSFHPPFPFPFLPFHLNLATFFLSFFLLAPRPGATNFFKSLLAYFSFFQSSCRRSTLQSTRLQHHFLPLNARTPSMRLLPRGTDFSSLATSLSLAIANYKPIPQLPSASGSQGSIASSDGARMQVSGSKLGHGSSFEVNTKPSKNQDGTLPSILYIPKTEKKLGGGNGAHAFVGGGATLGPGNCPVQDPYTPNGGWDALPAPVFPPFDAPKANVMRYRQQQGVDLGAW